MATTSSSEIHCDGGVTVEVENFRSFFVLRIWPAGDTGTEWRHMAKIFCRPDEREIEAWKALAKTLNEIHTTEEV